MFIKISEQPSLYNDLEKKSVHEILVDINREDQKVALAIQKTIPQIEKLVTQIVPRMKQGGRIFYMGAGTSGRLGVLDASEIPPTFGMPPTLVIGLIAGGDTALRNPVENAEDDMQRGWEELVERNITDKDTVIGIAASGTTPYVIGALHEAREHGILTACITSNPDSPMAAESDVAIEMIVGPEYVTGSSRMKSGTGQKMILNMITTSVMIQLGRVKGNKMVNMQLSNKKLVDRGTRMLVEELGLDYGKAKALLLSFLFLFCGLQITIAQPLQHVVPEQAHPTPRIYTEHYYKRFIQFMDEAPISNKDIVMLGNSLTENGGNWAARLGNKHVRNRGIIGDEVMGVYDRLHQILPGHPAKVFLLIGVNDISHGLTSDSIVSMIRTTVERIRKESPDTRLYLQSLPDYKQKR